MKAPYYIRVSSEQQTKNFSLPGQIDEGKRTFARDGVEWDDTLVFYDDESGTHSDRGGLAEWLAEATSGGYTHAYFNAIDRLGRDLLNNLTIKRTFERAGVKLISVNDQVDLDSAAGKWVFAIRSLQAETFLDDLKRNVTRGKRKRATSGLSNASSPPYGYKREIVQTLPRIIQNLVPDEKTKEAVVLAFEMYATGNYSYQDIADELNRRGFRGPRKRGSNGTISHQSVVQWLKNRFYCGDVRRIERDGKRVLSIDWFPGVHEAIISRELYDKVQQVKPTRYNAGRSVHRNSAVFPFGRGMAQCASCGEPLQSGKSGYRRYYRCTSGFRGITCNAPQTRVRSDVIEDSITPWFKSFKLTKKQVAEATALINKKLKVQNPDNERKKLVEERRRLAKIYRSGAVTDAEFERDDTALLGRIRALGEMSETLKRQMVTLEEAAKRLGDVGKLWQDATLLQRRMIAQELFTHLKVDMALGQVVAFLPKTPLLGDDWVVLASD